MFKVTFLLAFRDSPAIWLQRIACMIIRWTKTGESGAVIKRTMDEVRRRDFFLTRRIYFILQNRCSFNLFIGGTGIWGDSRIQETKQNKSVTQHGGKTNHLVCHTR
jgi:hypothetical protein